MFKKGEIGVGGILIAFIAIIVGLALMNGGIFDAIGTMTQKVTVANQTVTLPAAGSIVGLTGQAIESVIVTNASDGAVVPATNYTTQSRVVSNGALTANLLSNGGLFVSKSVNVSYIYEPAGYETSSGGRALISLIAIFMALAVAVVALTPTFRNGVLDIFGK